MKKGILLILCMTMLSLSLSAQVRQERMISEWKFKRGAATGAEAVGYDDRKWQTVSVPHDWAVSGPFDKEIDKQTVAIVQNGEKEATEKTGRSGSLPWIGEGWYRTQFTVEKDCGRALLNFDGAMSEPMVYVNGQLAGEWKYGYSAFNIDITRYIHKDGKANTLAVHLQNVEESSRWYPGAGLYRPVKLITTGAYAISEWSINVETIDYQSGSKTAKVRMSVHTEGDQTDVKEPMSIRVELVADGASKSDGQLQTLTIPLATYDCFGCAHGTKEFEIANVACWSPENPQLYQLTFNLMDNNQRVLDRKTVKTGFRTVKVSDARGFELNGKSRKFKGVCLHHDLGMLGAAVNKAALAHQLKLLKSMGCDAIRTSHNMPSQWQMELCDSLGLMVMAESFDMWKYAKCKNGYARFYDEWWKRDLRNLVDANKLHPSIVMWSIGNEIPEQGMKEGNSMTRDMQNLMHRHDPTRPVTAGMDRIDNALGTGYAQILDVPGMNYRTQKYFMAYERLRHGFVLGSETASTVSSRGVYKFPVEFRKSHAYDDGQCSGYDVEACSWSNLPEEDWTLQDDQPWVIGEFVWTGFDYLGEPTPYDEYWPSRSSYFGIFDLAGLPKDRYYLYRSKWNTKEETIHLLPHWTWPGREGEVTPVYCYTNYPTAELFVNGKSQGKITKQKKGDVPSDIDYKSDAAKTNLLDRYRLRWSNVVYEPGELKVVVYDAKGNKRGEEIVRTAGKPHHIVLKADKGVLSADGADMVFVTASVVDSEGNVCPEADNSLQVSVSGAAQFKGICNGDATSLEVFTKPQMKVFKGLLSVGVISNGRAGQAQVTVKGKGLKPATLQLKAQ